MIIPSYQDILLASIELRGLQFLLQGDELKQYKTFVKRSLDYKNAAREKAKEWYS